MHEVIKTYILHSLLIIYLFLKLNNHNWLVFSLATFTYKLLIILDIRVYIGIHQPISNTMHIDTNTSETLNWWLIIIQLFISL